MRARFDAGNKALQRDHLALARGAPTIRRHARRINFHLFDPRALGRRFRRRDQFFQIDLGQRVAHQRKRVVAQRRDAGVHFREAPRREPREFREHRRRALGVTAVVDNLETLDDQLLAKPVAFRARRNIAFQRHAKAFSLHLESEGMNGLDGPRLVERGARAVHLANREQRLVAPRRRQHDPGNHDITPVRGDLGAVQRAFLLRDKLGGAI